VSGRDSVTLQGDAYIGHLGDAQTLSTFTPPATFVSYKSTNVVGGNLLGRWRRDLPAKADLYLQAFWARFSRGAEFWGDAGHVRCGLSASDAADCVAAVHVWSRGAVEPEHDAADNSHG
jgi:hypothetical protein